MNRRRLYRSERDRVISGVCGGLADYFDVDPTLVRVIFVVLGFVPFPSAGLWLYIVMALVVPPEPLDWTQDEPWAPGGAPTGGPPAGGYPASYTPPTAGEPSGPATSDAGTTGADQAANPSGDAAASSTTQTWTPDGSGGPGPASPGPAGWTPPVPPTDWRSQRRQDRWDRRQERWQRRQERWQGRRERRDARGGSGGLLFGLLLILVGGVLLWHQIDPRLNFDLAWPAIVVLFGIVLIAFSFFPGRHRDG